MADGGWGMAVADGGLISWLKKKKKDGDTVKFIS